MRATIYKTAIKKQDNGFKMMELVKEASRNYKDTPTALNDPYKVYQQIERIINPSELSEVECGELLGIKVLDHIVTGDGVFHSLREHGQM